MSAAGSPPGLEPAGPEVEVLDVGGRHRLPRWLTALLVVAIVTAVVVAVVVALGRSVDTPPSSPAASSPSRLTRSPSPETPCTAGRPLAREPHPADGRVHGGGLSYRPPSGWRVGSRQAPFTWAHDVAESDATVDSTWFTMYAVGTIAIKPGQDTPRRAAELAMSCTQHSSLFGPHTYRADVSSAATRIDGHPAWSIRTAMIVDETSPVTNDLVQLTVVDLGSSDWLSFFWGSAPIANRALVQQLDDVTDAVRAD